jgi:cysteinyl-tRNA synthetase
MGDKRNAHDFALWKFPPKVGVREMEWESPWGTGFPGWHIECSAMAMRYLGGQFDIHTGGIDHIPVHHTNEIAQARAAGYPFADHWIHTAFLVNDRGEKMSKSSGATSRLPDVLKEYDITADALRYLYLTNHYRSPLTFGPERVEQARVSHDRMLDAATVLRHQATAVNQAPSEPSAEANRLWAEFRGHVTTDLNTPAAIDTVHAVLKAKRVSAAEKVVLLHQMDNALGLGVESSITKVKLTVVQEELLVIRGAARAAKDYAAADRLRTDLEQDGIRIIDAPGGQQLVRRTGRNA